MERRKERQRAALAAIAVLAEPTRRLLFDHVVGRRHPVSRDEAAAALDLPRTTAAFHLDRLVDEDLLDVVYERRSGRSGPGAGRPAKLYRRSGREVMVSLPERSYALVGRLLAAAVEEADDSGQSPRCVLNRRAYELGSELGARSEAPDRKDPRGALLALLEGYGYQPHVDGAQVLLGNCPFHALAQEHTALVCGMNLSLLEGMLNGLAGTGLAPELCSSSASCCLSLTPVDTS